MIILITGASHTGKTFLAQRMLEEYKGTDSELGKRLTKMGYEHKRTNKGSVVRVEEI